ncbi:type IV pilin protein [Cellvibrio sp. NN19]|uniref:type IV pilin protein n=1 Tax=Cellvibrio chitinivorans TaxID=3102792 RepID=UPI002B40FA83|nr:type IV pilin protein [Cellvibrio sp. NN19]
MRLPLRPAVMAYGQSAFTMIEMMIVVAVVAILAAIALPSYNGYIIKSEMRSAQADLLALSLNFENRYQRTLSYPTVATNTTAGLEDQFKAWTPSAKTNFSYSVTVNTATAYTLQASGSGRQSGCIITLTNENVRAASNCKYGNGDWL